MGDDEEVDGSGQDHYDVIVENEMELPLGPILDLSHEQVMAAKLDLPERAQLGRKEKRKQLKKLKRKQIRQQVAQEEKLKEETGLDGEEEQVRIKVEEQLEAERLALEKAEHDEEERLWVEREKKAIEDFQRRQEDLRKLEEDREPQDAQEDREYVDDDGPAEIIWKGNEIIVRKRRVKVPAADPHASQAQQDDTQATSNPLPPQSTAFAAHKQYLAAPAVGEQNTVFGTEQDKTHCPFHIKTGVCRYGVRCSRVHVYPEHSFTLLVRNMYTGPGLAWENDEGLENSVEQGFEGRWMARAFGGWMKGNEQPVDEEVAQHYEEFYEDVHPEFLQFGELVNFKVCNNTSSHLRGNLYVHYKTEASAQAAYNALNGRFYAGKQITCEFVGVTKWRVALCGEYMRDRHRCCSHGSACNFLHCFRNPHSEYEWADWDAHRPRYWVAKMAKMFGYENELEQDSDYESHDDLRRHRRSSDSPRQRESRYWERRSRDRHHYSSRDDLHNSSRHRRHKRQENGGDHYRSISDDPGRSSTHRSNRRRDTRDFSSSKDLDEKGRGHERDTSHGSRRESATRDSYESRSNGREQQQKRHRSGSGDLQGEVVEEFTHERRRATSRDRGGSSNRLFQDTDNDGKYARHRSGDLRDSDRRQLLDFRRRTGRSKTSQRVSPTDQTESRSEDAPPKEKYHKKGLDSRIRKYTSGRSADLSDSSGSSDSDQSHRRQRVSNHRSGDGRRSGRKKARTQEYEIESEEKSSYIDDRWTGIMES